MIIALLRYWGGMINGREEMLMTKHRALHPIVNNDQIHLLKEKLGRTINRRIRSTGRRARGAERGGDCLERKLQRKD